MKLAFWHHSPSVHELQSAEQRGAERYARHVHLDELRASLEATHGEIARLEAVAYGLESLLREAQLHLPDGDLADKVAAAIGPAPQLTGVVALAGGGFMEVPRAVN